MISIKANEEGTLKIVIAFTDEDDVEHAISTLNSVRWQLSDPYGNVINDQSFANNLIITDTVILTGDDLAIGNSGSCRVFAVKIVYDSSNGNDLNATEEETFAIDDLVNIG